MPARYLLDVVYGRDASAVELQSIDSEIAVVTVNRPDKLNAIDGSLMNGVDDALAELESGAYRVAILTGADPVRAHRAKRAPVWNEL